MMAGLWNSFTTWVGNIAAVTPVATQPVRMNAQPLLGRRDMEIPQQILRQQGHDPRDFHIDNRTKHVTPLAEVRRPPPAQGGFLHASVYAVDPLEGLFNAYKDDPARITAAVRDARRYEEAAGLYEQNPTSSALVWRDLINPNRKPHYPITASENVPDAALAGSPDTQGISMGMRRPGVFSIAQPEVIKHEVQHHYARPSDPDWRNRGEDVGPAPYSPILGTSKTDQDWVNYHFNPEEIRAEHLQQKREVHSWLQERNARGPTAPIPASLLQRVYRGRMAENPEAYIKPDRLQFLRELNLLDDYLDTVVHWTPAWAQTTATELPYV